MASLRASLATVLPRAVLRVIAHVTPEPDRRRRLAREIDLPRAAAGRWNAETLIRAWGLAVDRPVCRRLALELGSRSRLDDWDLLGWVVRTAPDGLASMRAAARCYGLITDRGRFSIDEEEDRIWVRWSAPETRGDAGAIADLGALAHFAQGTREILGPVRFEAVELRELGLLERSMIGRHFDCAIRGGADHDGFAIDRRALERVLPQANGGLHQHLCAEAERTLASFRPDTFAERVRAAISAGALDVDDVARALRLSRRTLQRRLGAEGRTFRELLDERRSVVAERALAQGRSVSEVADALGFSDPTALSRAHRRWFGRPPRRARAR